eukprot:3415693-Amphidinium_carterae.1
MPPNGKDKWETSVFEEHSFTLGACLLPYCEQSIRAVMRKVSLESPGAPARSGRTCAFKTMSMRSTRMT